MTSVIRSPDSAPGQPVRSVDWSALVQPSITAPAVDPELLALRDEVARLRRDALAHSAAIAQSAAAGREEGRAEAERAYRRDDEYALRALREGVEIAIGAAKPRFAEIDKIALCFAEAALEAVFGETGDYRERVVQSIRHQAAALRSHAVLHVSVSAADFPDAYALDELAARVQTHGLTVRSCATIGSGSARFTLALGELEIDLPRHWDELRALLKTLAVSTSGVAS